MSDTTNLFSVTEIELVYRNKLKASDRPKIRTSKDAYDLFMRSWDLNKIELVEQFKVILLDRRNASLGVPTISTGGITGCVVDARIVFAAALKARATGVILCHNHPSGNLQPSEADLELTSRLFHGGKLLDISVLDHLILTNEGFTSCADEGFRPF